MLASSHLYPFVYPTIRWSGLPLNALVTMHAIMWRLCSFVQECDSTEFISWTVSPAVNLTICLLKVSLSARSLFLTLRQASKFGGRVERYHVDDHNVPPLEDMIRYIVNIQSVRQSLTLSSKPVQSHDHTMRALYEDASLDSL